MRGVTGARPGAVVALSLVVAMGVAGGTTASVATPETDGAYGAASTPAIERVDLARPVRGANAVRVLGGHLAEAAARNDMSDAQLADLLRTDRTAWLDTEGVVFFKDEGAAAPALDPVSAQAPLEETFLLHSKPGSQHTVFLDFDGGTASATGWHATYPALPVSQPAWDPSGNGAAFDDTELAKIQTVWQIVAEDFAPFDVDVTTADPGSAAIARDSAADPVFGSHVLVTPSVETQQAICPAGCGGTAYIGVFDAVRGPGGDGYGYRQPAWVFPHRLGNSAKNVGEAASHEVGHNLGLSHDGNGSVGYDRGHGAWAPIMGAGYDRPITQWSKGDYTGATNTEDDVAIISAVTGNRPDEAGSGVGDAAPVPVGGAYIGSRDDIDTFALGTCEGAVTLSADTSTSFADLDLQVTLLDSAGNTVAVADPASSMTSASLAGGMAATLSQSVASGAYFAAVDGTGSGPWASGYDDYGSLGAYTLTASGCDGSTPEVVPTPTPTPLVPAVTSAPDPVGVTPPGPNATTPDRLAVSTTVVRGPRKARAGSRPAIVISVVGGSSAASGKVVVTIGKRTTTLTLKAGAAKLKPPRLKKGKVRIVARYLGNASTAASSTTWRIKVTRA